MAVMLKNHHIT